MITCEPELLVTICDMVMIIMVMYDNTVHVWYCIVMRYLQ